jgi:hypothetical protein
MNLIIPTEESPDERLAVFQNQRTLYLEKVAGALAELRFALSSQLIGVDMRIARRRRRATVILPYSLE